MKSIVMGIVLAAFALVAVPRVDAQAQELQQKLGAAKPSAPRNQKALRSYSWLEKNEFSLKGEVKKKVEEKIKDKLKDLFKR